MRTLIRHSDVRLLAILVLALLLRVVSLADHSLWYDEAFSVLFAQNDVATMLEGTVNAVEHPLLYYLTLNGWMDVFGTSTAAVRSLSLVLGVLTVALVYAVTKQLFDDRRTAYVAALLTALMPFHVLYSQEARMYSLLAFLLLLSTGSFVRAYPRLRSDAADTEGRAAWGWWALFGVFSGLALHTQQHAAFYLLALGLIPLAQRHWREFRGVVLGGVLALVIFAPWLLNLPAQLASLNENYWIPQPSLAAPLFTLRVFLGGALEVDSTQSLMLFGGALLLSLFLLLQIAFYSRRMRYRRQSDRRPVYVVLWLFVGPLVLLWLFSQFVPIYLDRAMIASALMLYVLLAWLFTRSQTPRPIAFVLMGLCAVMIVMGDAAVYRLNSFPYSPVQEMIAYLDEHAQDGDVILHMNKLTALPAQVYGSHHTQRFLADAPGADEDTLDPSTQAVLGIRESQCVQEAIAGAERVWFVVLQRAQREYAATGRTELQDTVDWLDAHFSQVDTHTIGDLTLDRYAEPVESLSTECEPE